MSRVPSIRTSIGSSPTSTCPTSGSTILRHTTATTLLEAGVHPKLVQDLLGHSTIAVTLDTYSHVAPALHQRAAMQLQELLAHAAERSHIC